MRDIGGRGKRDIGGGVRDIGGGVRDIPPWTPNDFPQVTQF